MDAAQRWGLPPGFTPVRYAVSDPVKEIVRSQLGSDEPVVVSLANEGDTISFVATPQRLLTVRSGGVTAGVTGFDVRSFPWEGINKLILQQAALNVKIAVHYKTCDGRTVEVGRRAALGRPAIDNLMPFETVAGKEAFEAIYQIWENRKPDATPLY